MGAGEAAAITSRLIAAGRDPETPVTVVVNGSLPEERVLSGRLHELPFLVSVHAMEGPAMLFIGAVAAFAGAATGFAQRIEAAA